MDAKQVQHFKNKQEDEVLEQAEYFDTTELSIVETDHPGEIATT